MYQYIDGTCALSVNDWCAAGLTLTDFYNDTRRHQLTTSSVMSNGRSFIYFSPV